MNNASNVRKKRATLQRRVKNYIEVFKRRLFNCRNCGSSFKSKQLLFKHVETHIGTPISCRICKRCYNNRLAYNIHVKLGMCTTKIDIPRFECEQCPKVFRFKRHFERHQEGHKRNNCTYCEIKLTKRSELVEHLQAVHSIKLERAVLFKCDYCEKRYVKKRSLYYHLKQHADNKIVCMECGFMSLTKEEHNIHFLKHDKDRPWRCEKCNDRFSRKQQYLLHLKCHDRYKCLSCNISHAARAIMLRHKQRGHTVQGLEPHLKCPHCPTAFYRRYALQIHLRKHNEDKPMHCKYCSKSFRSPYLYFKHCASTIHEIKSPAKMQLVCEICGRLFMKKYQLELHLKRVHNQNKQVFNCTYCSHKTTNSKNMERHIALHLETRKDFICEQCGKTYYNINTLKDHVSYVHIQERQFKCEECGKCFKRNSELIRHRTSHSEVRPHTCNVCGQSYKRLTHLKRHEKSQHGTIPNTRKVQRLVKDIDGILKPIEEDKGNKAKNKKKQQEKNQVFSLMDTQSGELVTFEIPNVATILNLNNQSYSQEISVSIPYNDLLNNKINDSSNILINEINTNAFANQILDSSSISQTQTYSNILQEVIENSTTCDILLPENMMENQQNSENYLNNPYNFL